MPNKNRNTPEPTRGAVTYAPHPIPPTAPAAPVETGTIADTRARFGIPRSTQYRLAAAGQIRMIKLGRTILVDFARVRAFLGSEVGSAACRERGQVSGVAV